MVRFEAAPRSELTLDVSPPAPDDAEQWVARSRTPAVFARAADADACSPAKLGSPAKLSPEKAPVKARGAQIVDDWMRSYALEQRASAMGTPGGSAPPPPAGQRAPPPPPPGPVHL